MPNLSSSDSASVRYDPVENDIELGESNRQRPHGNSPSDNRHVGRILPILNSVAAEPKQTPGTLSSTIKDFIADS